MDSSGIIGLISRIREAANLYIEQELKTRNIKGILPAHGSLLNYLYSQSGPVPIKSIVDKLGKAKSTVTAMVNNLERNGYIQKFPSQADHRVIYVELTKKAIALKKDFNEISSGLLQKVYKNIDEEEQKYLMGQLLRIETSLRE